jgi:hypothetical protein
LLVQNHQYPRVTKALGVGRIFRNNRPLPENGFDLSGACPRACQRQDPGALGGGILRISLKHYIASINSNSLLIAS